MVGILKVSPLLRAIGIIGAVAALVTGITFSALSSSATLTNTTMSSATASLQLYDFGIPNWASTAPGFTITNLVPGEGSGPQNFYFRNNGGVDLNIKAYVPTLPAVTNIALYSDVEVTFNCFGATGPAVTNLEALNTGTGVSLNLTLPAGATGNAGNPSTLGNCSATFDLDPDGVSGSSASVAAFNIVFTGVQDFST